MATYHTHSHTTYSNLGFTFGPLLFRRCFSFIADVHEQPSSAHEALKHSQWRRSQKAAVRVAHSHEMRLGDATLAPIMRRLRAPEVERLIPVRTGVWECFDFILSLVFSLQAFVWRPVLQRSLTTRSVVLLYCSCKLHKDPNSTYYRVLFVCKWCLERTHFREYLWGNSGGRGRLALSFEDNLSRWERVGWAQAGWHFSLMREVRCCRLQTGARWTLKSLQDTIITAALVWNNRFISLPVGRPAHLQL